MGSGPPQPAPQVPWPLEPSREGQPSLRSPGVELPFLPESFLRTVYSISPGTELIHGRCSRPKQETKGPMVPELFIRYVLIELG